ncbi:hypothetical protein ES319_D05G105500v1 [Gossypium barbadense]|uniref:Uncharacterized protein n=1 Tax=Gossypium barbadense TaxID=3634 RepID=A0A2P5XUC6_GOSBA|nr:hypothetical protein ES319_D05G105500v1 [Gossypium barbadense]KAB2028559.1 hypothetical protein ES319_D05G105500v1 [Gossypium barbadense]KAB2028560.1 hypothetical protein ES319_D05G105500v1 [Gossypium barbadense]PPS06959.1 hypothetical protein GOBAR_AA13681 [Gossypium barbadense]
MGTIHRSGVFKKTNDKARLVIATILGIVIGFFIGVSFPSVSLYKIHLPSNLRSSFDAFRANDQDFIVRSPERTADNLPKIYVPTNPRGAELLPPGIVVPESDLYLRRLWGEPSEDLKKKPKYLVTFTVGFDQRSNIDKCVKKFSEDFQILLFHYDGRTTEWDQFEWSKNAIHVSVKKQTKWWYAKRFLHPDVVSAYEYIFIWDEDLGVEHFNAERYIELVKKHGLEISQPGLEPNNGLTWQMTKRRGDREVHKFTEEKPGWCSDPHLPPCAAFVEIMAPVFSREAWRCVWYMIQNDLVHGWGLDFALRRCVEPAHEKIGVVDSQWIIHQVIPSLGSQGKSEDGKPPWEGVKTRCKKEWSMFQNRLANADKAYLAQLGKE